MASYRIILKPLVEKDLRALPSSVADRILERIQALSHVPHPRLSVKLAGAEHLYRIRVGDYRVVYSVSPGVRDVIVQYVRHRRDVYRNL